MGMLLCFRRYIAMSDFQLFLDENLGTVRLSDEDASGDLAGSYDIYQEIRDAILSIRRENHLTQKELAKKTGLTQANISNLEKGLSKPTIDTLKRIADATGMRLVIEFVGQEVV